MNGINDFNALICDYKKNPKILLILIFFLTIYSNTMAQDKLSVSGGIVVNTMFDLNNYPTGLGANIDLNYYPNKTSFFLLTLRAKYINYNLDETYDIEYNSDGSSYPVFDKMPDFIYNFSIPQIGLVPKFVYKVDSDISLFFENDLSIGMLKGYTKYLTDRTYMKKNILEYRFIYSPSLGILFRINNIRLSGSMGYSFLDFRPIIIKNKPIEYKRNVSRQDTGLLFNISISIPIVK